MSYVQQRATEVIRISSTVNPERLSAELARYGLLTDPNTARVIEAAVAWRDMEITLCAGAHPIKESVDQFRARITQNLRDAVDNLRQ